MTAALPFRLTRRLASLLPCTLTLDAEWSPPASPFEAISAFSIVFSEGAHYTVALPKEVLIDSCRVLGVQPSRSWLVSNRALIRASSFRSIKDRVRERVATWIDDLGDQDAEALLAHVDAIRSGHVGRVIETDAYTVVPNDSVGHRRGGTIYTYAQGSCVVIAGTWADADVFVGHFQTKLVEDLIRGVRELLETAGADHPTIFVIAKDPMPIVSRLGTAWPEKFLDDIRVHRKKSDPPGNYNLKFERGKSGITVDHSWIASSAFFPRPYLRYGHQMALPFANDTLPFETIKKGGEA